MHDLDLTAGCFDFFSMMQWLEHCYPEFFNSIVVCSSIETNFPTRDVQNLDLDNMKLVVNFSGLVGVDAVLPRFYVDLSLQSKNEWFIDLLQRLQNSFYHDYYRAWCQRHAVADRSRRLHQYLACAVGSQQQSFTKINNCQYWFSTIRDVEQLQKILRDDLGIRFETLKIKLQNDWVTIDPKNRVLNDGALLGKQVFIKNYLLEVVLEFSDLNEMQKISSSVLQSMSVVVKEFIGVLSKMILKTHHVGARQRMRLSNSHSLLTCSCRSFFV